MFCYVLIVQSIKFTVRRVCAFQFIQERYVVNFTWCFTDYWTKGKRMLVDLNSKISICGIHFVCLSVTASDTNPNMLTLSQPTEFGNRTNETLSSYGGGGGSMRSQSWMNTLSSASTTSKRSSGGPASKTLSSFGSLYVVCVLCKWYSSVVCKLIWWYWFDVFCEMRTGYITTL